MQRSRPRFTRPGFGYDLVLATSRRNPILAVAAIACLSLTGVVLWLLQEQAAPPAGLSRPAKSIAVLPFENLNNDRENAFFAAGMQDDILTGLSKIADLKVINTRSVQTFRSDTPRNLRQIGRELGVRHVLEGSVRRWGDRVRISARLLNTDTGAQLWADQYDRTLADVFVIQGEIAQQIANQLQAQLSPREQATIQAPPTRDMVAYDLYLQAKEIADRPGPSTAVQTERKVALLDEVIRRDPSFVPALCLLASVHVRSYWSNYDHTPARLARAEAALQAAARLEPDSGLVHLTRGVLHYWGYRDYKPALAELELARQALPNNADVPYVVGLIERRQGRWEESTRHLEQSRTLDPRNLVALFDLTRTNYFALKRYRDAGIDAFFNIFNS